MAAIAYASTVQNSAQTSTSTSFVDVTGASITSGNFVAGQKYLILATWQQTNTSSGVRSMGQVIHGSTTFEGSDNDFTSRTANEYITGAYSTVWTAVASEAVKLQFKCSSGTVKVDQVQLFAMRLDADLTENTDWFFGESTTDETLNVAGTFEDGGSVTFTGAGEDWLVLSMSQVDINAAGNVTSRINNSNGSTTTPSAIQTDDNNTGVKGFNLSRVFAGLSGSSTIKEQSTSDETTSIRLYSNIFALKMNKFAARAGAYTDADANLSATNYATNLQTTSITPTVTGDVLIGSYWGADRAATGREVEFRVQVDSADQPAAQSTDNYQFDADNVATNEHPLTLYTLANLNTSSHTINLDASADATTSTPTGQHRSLWAFTMELPAAGGGGTKLHTLTLLGVS